MLAEGGGEFFLVSTRQRICFGGATCRKFILVDSQVRYHTLAQRLARKLVWQSAGQRIYFARVPDQQLILAERRAGKLFWQSTRPGVVFWRSARPGISFGRAADGALFWRSDHLRTTDWVNLSHKAQSYTAGLKMFTPGTVCFWFLLGGKCSLLKGHPIQALYMRAFSNLQPPSHLGVPLLLPSGPQVTGLVASSLAVLCHRRILAFPIH